MSETLENLLKYAPETAAGIMTTEFASVPSSWTVEKALKFISQVGHAKETVYAIYVLDASNGKLVRVVSLRELIVAPRDSVVTEAGTGRALITVSPDTDREEVARIISKYNLLAVPIVDDEMHVLGIVTVDDDRTIRHCARPEERECAHNRRLPNRRPEVVQN